MVETLRRVVGRKVEAEGGYDNLGDVPMLAGRLGFVLSFDGVEVWKDDGRVERDGVSD